MMSADDIREKFLKFFESKGHTIVSSDSVVPKDDPTVLFTTAGMQQFKRQFLGQGVTFRRATTCQKCLRTDDLDQIGITPVHHTFFEMLGNFSFGDYFKEDAIKWAWEFFTDVLKISSDKLWVSVYEEDEEAYNIWRNKIKISEKRILKLGDKDNFWPAEAKTKGPNGPCGPCSEIFFDFGTNPDCPKGKECNPECNCGRFAEVWNLVFTQFNRQEGGVLEPLREKNIDTGMGLERLVAVVQGKRSNYETDLFELILKEIEQEIEENKKTRLQEREKHVIADHIRAIVFGIADGVVPSNKARGSVIKKLIRVCTDLVLVNQQIDAPKAIKGPSIYKLVPSVIRVMKEQYPELVPKRDVIKSIVKTVEESYIKNWDIQIPLVQDLMLILKNSSKYESKEERNRAIGKFCFTAYATYGLSESTIQAILFEIGIVGSDLEDVWKVYLKEFEEEKNRSRAGSKMTDRNSTH